MREGDGEGFLFIVNKWGCKLVFASFELPSYVVIISFTLSLSREQIIK